MAITEMLRKHRRTIQTAAQSWEQKQLPRVPDSPVAKISETKILAYFAKSCTRENYQPYGIHLGGEAHTHLSSGTCSNSELSQW